VTHIHAQWVSGGVLVPFWRSGSDGVVHLLCLMFFELHTQCPVRFCCTRKDHHPAGDFVQPVNHPGFPILILEQLDQVRGVLFPAIGQYRYPGEFVYDEKVSIFVQDE